MKYDPSKHHRKSIRLKGYDYSQPGAYFVTICTEGGVCLFGDGVDGHMYPNRYGKIILECWEWMNAYYPYLRSDAVIVMPNHLHGILNILETVCRGDSRIAPTEILTVKPLGRLIGAFKTVTTKRINQDRQTTGTKLWQRNYVACPDFISGSI